MSSDSKIIELFYARDEQAIVELSAKYGAVCRSISNNILKSEQDAEECVNDTYLAAWNNIPPAKPDPLRTYILRIARNISTAKYHANTASKRNSHYDVALDELEECLGDLMTLDESLASRELSSLIDAFLDTLSQADRVMFVRRYWYSDSIPEIAKILSISKNNVSVRLSRTREKLRNQLRKEGFDI